MVVGGSPGSTAGGVKTTTVAVLAVCTFSSFRGSRSPTAFGRRLPDGALRKSATILFFNAGLALGAALAICAIQPLPLVDVLFETFSAIGTVGMTTGITRALGGASVWIVALLMYLGRVGSVTFAVALLEKRARPPVSYPEEQITVG